ncbi:MAG: hypothetical protein NVS4B11_25700 [Ktedonobacteraceae bacterium]
MLTHLTDTLTNLITNLYVATGLFGIILAMAIESCCIPLPSEIVMPLAGIMIASGRILHGTNSTVSLFLVALAGAIGCLLGSIAAYGIGYSGGRPLMLKYGRYLLISQHDADKADQFFQRWGSATAFFSRLLPVVRTYISLPAGISEMPFVKFCVYTFLGSFPWCLLLAFVGIQLGNHLDTLSPIFHSLDIVILIVLVILVALYVWRHINNDRKARATSAQEVNNQSVAEQEMPAPQMWNQQSTPFSQPQQQGRYPQQPQVRQFQSPQQADPSEWNQQPFPQQQNWPPSPDDRTIRR